MTIICALHDEERNCTWLGSDTKSSFCDSFMIETRPKWTLGRHWALSVTGGIRAGGLYENHIEEIDEIKDPFDVATKLRDFLVEDGWNPFDDRSGTGKQFDTMTMLANPNGVWSIDCAFGCMGVPGFFAEGSGQDFAMAAVVGAQRALPTESPEKLVAIAVGSAIELCKSCGGEIWLHCLRNGT